jgi:hypothetical protein
MNQINDIYPNEDDPNVKLFKIYQWVMMHDSASLELVSALSLVNNFETECLL